MLTSPPEESVEHWGGLEVDDETEVIYGNVLQIGDAAFAYYGFSQYGSDRHVKLVNSCADMLEQYGAKLYDILIPTSVGVVVSSDYMELLKCTDQGQTISYIFSQVNELSLIHILPERCPRPRDLALRARGYRCLRAEGCLVFFVLSGGEVQVRRVLHEKPEYAALL